MLFQFNYTNKVANYNNVISHIILPTCNLVFTRVQEPLHKETFYCCGMSFYIYIGASNLLNQLLGFVSVTVREAYQH